MGNALRNEAFNENAQDYRPQWAHEDPTASASGVTLIAAPAAGSSIMILKYLVHHRGSVSGTITLLDGASQVSGIPKLALQAGGFIAVDNVGILLTSATAMKYSSTITDAYSIAVKYRIVPSV